MVITYKLPQTAEFKIQMYTKGKKISVISFWNDDFSEK